MKKLDWVMLLLLAVLMVISVLVVRSATYGFGPAYENYDIRTIILYAVGFVVALAASLIDYKLILKLWVYFFGLGVALLIAVLFAPEINNARSWFKITEGLLFQPAELMKILLILALAALMGRRQGEQLTLGKDLLPIAALSAIPFVLVMIQPDLGNAIIYIFIVLGMLWMGNVKYMHVLAGLVVVIGGMLLFVTLFNAYNDEIKTYLQEQNKNHWYQRINTYINPESASADERHQSEKAIIAIGSGGLTGDGYMQGDSKNQRFIPYPYSDSIFVVVGEEFGFQGAAVLLLVYFLFVYRMILIAFKCYDVRGAYIIIGIASMFVFQIFQNIGMMIGLMPITGITLPFISYGGTSLLMNMLSVGIVLSIKIHQEKYTLP